MKATRTVAILGAELADYLAYLRREGRKVVSIKPAAPHSGRDGYQHVTFDVEG